MARAKYGGYNQTFRSATSRSDGGQQDSSCTGGVSRYHRTARLAVLLPAASLPPASLPFTTHITSCCTAVNQVPMMWQTPLEPRWVLCQPQPMVCLRQTLLTGDCQVACRKTIQCCNDPSCMLAAGSDCCTHCRICLHKLLVQHNTHRVSCPVMQSNVQGFLKESITVHTGSQVDCTACAPALLSQQQRLACLQVGAKTITLRQAVIVSAERRTAAVPYAKQFASICGGRWCGTANSMPCHAMLLRCPLGGCQCLLLGGLEIGRAASAYGCAAAPTGRLAQHSTAQHSWQCSATTHTPCSQ